MKNEIEIYEIKSYEDILKYIIKIADILNQKINDINTNDFRIDNKEIINISELSKQNSIILKKFNTINSNIDNLLKIIKFSLNNKTVDERIKKIIFKILYSMEKDVTSLKNYFILLSAIFENNNQLKDLLFEIKEHFANIIDYLKTYYQEKALVEKYYNDNETLKINENVEILIKKFEELTTSNIQEETKEITYGNPFEELNIENKNFIAVGGSKGGTGKSFICSSMGILLANQGKKVIIIDVDLGAANLHTFLGIKYPPVTLSDFLYKNKKNINEILIDTEIPNLKFISGAKDILQLANLPYRTKIKLINNIKKLDADYILLDLGSGSSYNVIDFFRFAKNGLMIINPEPTSIENVSTFIKKTLFREITKNNNLNKYIEIRKKIEILIDPDNNEIKNIPEFIITLQKINPIFSQIVIDTIKKFKIKLVLNRVKTASDIKFANAVIEYSKNYLNLNIEFAGIVRENPSISNYIKNFKPFLLYNNNSEISLDLKKISYKLYS